MTQGSNSWRTVGPSRSGDQPVRGPLRGIEDQALDEVQAVDLMHYLWRETRQCTQRAYRVLISCVARVDNPCGVGELADVGDIALRTSSTMASNGCMRPGDWWA